MLCSKCSAIIKPIVAIDIDGTLGNYHQHFVSFAEEWLDWDPTDRPDSLYSGDCSYRDWFCKTYRVDVTTFRQIKLAYRQGGQKRSMPAYPGSLNLVASLKHEGAEVWLTTTRPHDRYDRVDPDTREWLRRHDFDLLYDGLLYDEDKMFALSERVESGRVVAVLDDEVEQLEKAAKAFNNKVPILRKTIYNHKTSMPVEVEQLYQARDLILDRMFDWRREFG